MSCAVIDVREWQVKVDFATGLPTEEDNENIQMAEKIISGHYYPGDLDENGVKWVIDMAEKIDRFYNPELLVMDFAQPFFYSLYGDYNKETWDKLVSNVFKNINQFITETDYTPIIVGLGDMTELKDYIDISHMDGLGIATNWSFRSAGVFNPSDKDIERINKLPNIERMITKEEFIEKYNPCKSMADRFPEYLLVAEEGYSFRGFQASARRLKRIPAKNQEVPVFSTIGKIEDITQIKDKIEKGINDNKIALIIIEGIGKKDFNLPYNMAVNNFDGYAYENLDNQYMALCTGKHLPELNFPPVYLYYEDDNEDSQYPFSGSYNTLPQDTIGRMKNIKTAAVGTRGMVTHIASGADICIECFARTLYNFGTMAVVNDKEVNI